MIYRTESNVLVQKLNFTYLKNHTYHTGGGK